MITFIFPFMTNLICSDPNFHIGLIVTFKSVHGEHLLVMSKAANEFPYVFICLYCLLIRVSCYNYTDNQTFNYQNTMFRVNVVIFKFVYIIFRRIFVKAASLFSK
jgi:hypothetical protein